MTSTSDQEHPSAPQGNVTQLSHEHGTGGVKFGEADQHDSNDA